MSALLPLPLVVPSSKTDKPNPASVKAAPFADLSVRLLAGIVMAGLALGALFAGGVVFVGFWLAAALAVHWEWQRLVGGALPVPRLYGGSAILVAAAVFAAAGHIGWGALLVAAAAGGFALFSARRDAASSGARWAAAGLCYAGTLLLCTVLLRQAFPFGFRAILWLFGIVWGTDVCAYFAGRLIGGPKIWPRVSPGKTWSGTLFGIVGGALIGVICLVFAASRSGLSAPSSLWALFLLGLVIAAVSQGGDFFESWIKRRFDVKDSGRLLPGHGGIMDRLDGFVAAVTVAVLIGALRDMPSVAEGLFHWS